MLAHGATLPLNQLQLPPGFSISVYAANVDDARSMTLGSKGTVFVGSKEAGKVYALIQDPAHPGRIKVLVIASHLKLPNGVAFKDGALYVAETTRIIKFDKIEERLQNPPAPVVISNELPDGKNHNWHYLKFGADGKLYVSIGAPCNACHSDDLRYATIMRMNPDGSEFEVFASGVRNSVGFDWHPMTHDLWFTDNGRDWLGDNIPPDKLNIASKANMNFGFPYCYGKDVPDPILGEEQPCSSFTLPALELPAHVAALGMTFYRGTMFPPEYQQRIFIAEHGSWNRSSKIGYQVVTVDVKDGVPVNRKPFVTGWLQRQEEWGRPVDVLQLADGALLVSDDKADVVYKIVYTK